MVLAPCTTRSALTALAGCAANLNYLFVEGTSQAAPHVSGAAALLDAQSGGALRATRLIAALQRTADDLGAPGRDPYYGRGRLNVCNLLGCEAAMPPGPTAALSSHGHGDGPGSHP
jgi:hypothetical protein